MNIYRISSVFVGGILFWGTVAHAAVTVDSSVTISSAATNTTYLNQDVNIASTGNLTYTDYVPSQTSAVTIDNQGSLTFNVTTESQYFANASHSGTLTLTGKGFTKTGAGNLYSFQGNYEMYYKFASGSTVDIQAGRFYNGDWLEQHWEENKADLNIAAGATVDLWDGGINNATYGNVKTGMIVDALTGSGNISATAGSYPGLFVMGADNGDGTFSGKFLGGVKDKAIDVKTISIQKVGTGTQKLTGENGYTGTTKITGGTLQIGDGGTVGSIGPGAVTIEENGTLAFARTDILTFANSVTNRGTIAVNSGILDLTNLEGNGNTGKYTIGAGAGSSVLTKTMLTNTTADATSLLLLRGSATDTSAWTASEIAGYRNGTTTLTGKVGVSVAAGETFVGDAVLVGTTSLYKGGAGTLSLTAANPTFTQGIHVVSGTVALSGEATLAADNVIELESNGAFTYDYGAGTTTTVANTITGAGTLEIRTGTVQFTTASPKSTTSQTGKAQTAYTQTAQTVIRDGATLSFADTVAPHPEGTATITVENGGKLQFVSTSYSSVGHDTNHCLVNGSTASILTLAGAGTVEFTGGGTTAFMYGNTASSRVKASLSTGGWMDVTNNSKLVLGGWSSQIVWTNNKGSLNVGAGSLTSLWDGNEITIDSLTGSGTVQSGAIRLGIANNENSQTYGVTNNTATFSGILKDEAVNGSVKGGSKNLRISSVLKI